MQNANGPCRYNPQPCQQDMSNGPNPFKHWMLNGCAEGLGSAGPLWKPSRTKITSWCDTNHEDKGRFRSWLPPIAAAWKNYWFSIIQTELPFSPQTHRCHSSRLKRTENNDHYQTGSFSSAFRSDEHHVTRLLNTAMALVEVLMVVRTQSSIRVTFVLWF